jgi:hypothetical protein
MISGVLLIVAMSRPCASHAAASTSSLCGSSGTPAVQFHMSAYLAARGIVLFSPWPPIMIGGPPARTGGGELSASCVR